MLILHFIIVYIYNSIREEYWVLFFTQRFLRFSSLSQKSSNALIYLSIPQFDFHYSFNSINFTIFACAQTSHCSLGRSIPLNVRILLHRLLYPRISLLFLQMFLQQLTFLILFTSQFFVSCSLNHLFVYFCSVLCYKAL